MLPRLKEILTYQVRQETADSLNFRKAGEERNSELRLGLEEERIILQKRISFDLMRIFILLRDERVIRQFLEIAGLGERFFFDMVLCDSPFVRDRVFAGIRARGWTRKQRFRNLVCDCYERLAAHFDIYINDLVPSKDHGHRHHFEPILTILRSMSGAKAWEPEPSAYGGAAAAKSGPWVVAVPPRLAVVKARLKKLIDQAWGARLSDPLDVFSHGRFFGPSRNRRIQDRQ